MTVNAQFEIPTHPACVTITTDIIERGLVNIAKCRQLLAASRPTRSVQANTRMADASIELAGGGSAVEYKAHLRQLKAEGLA